MSAEGTNELNMDSASRKNSKPQEHEMGFSSTDLSDERTPLDWKSKYPKEAQTFIRTEIIYLAFFLILSPVLVIVLYILKDYYCMQLLTTLEPYIVGYLGGAFGGSMFGLKWTYHVIAKQYWHLDRRAWRFSIPLISGSLSIIFISLISSSLIGIFDPGILSKTSATFAIGSLVGYFSDNAIRKLVEVADTLFGTKR
jgi:hypothetical protein